MVEEISLGISNRTFIAGLIIAILASSVLSTVVATQWAIGPQGPKGDKGDTGPQGIQGETGTQGPQGPPGVFTVENLSGWLPAPAYDSGWIDVTDYTLGFWHELNTTEVFVYVIRNNSEFGINQYTPAGVTFPVEWHHLSKNAISVRIAPISPKPSYDEIRVMIWKIAEP